MVLKQFQYYSISLDRASSNIFFLHMEHLRQIATTNKTILLQVVQEGLFQTVVKKFYKFIIEVGRGKMKNGE